ncbi:uncharacterized protein LOC110709357 [Chenopodium quinoa]|uniref:uncharacterized protein LOC110709357 n=1 Tax=Chenopodium quinoa TaxID=63459 RepID=UPI000B770B1A|nr:uncharacterized protein LOC110709357 [Chenopodium quinoa]
MEPKGFAPIASINKPFKFQAAWLTHDNFRVFLESKWVKSSPLVPLLKKVGNDLQEWNREVFHNIFKKKRNLLARITRVQKSLAEQRSRDLIKLESKLCKELDEVLEQEELLWYQRSRIEWIRDGDRNTSFFHLSTISRRWRNNITTIEDINSGEWMFEKDKIQQHIVSYFQNLFTAEEQQALGPLPTRIFPDFTQRDWNCLSKPFAKCEVERVVFEMGSMKAPVPDGFQALFFRKHWDLVAENVYKIALDALNGKGFPENLNETFIVLIPKVDTPEFATQF